MSSARAQNQEQLLLDHADRLAKHREGRIALQIHLSRLKSYHRREHHLRIAAETFVDATSGLEGQSFILASGDIMFVALRPNPEIIQKAIGRLHTLFGEDPLLSGPARGTSFCSLWRLDTQYDQFRDACLRLRDAEVERQKTIAKLTTEEPAELKPLDPRRLAEIVDILRSADISAVARSQPIVAMTGDTMQTVYRELYVDLGRLGAQVAPGIDLFADRGLFRHLAQWLDRAMLRHVVKELGSSASPVGLNLNTETLLTKTFASFDNRIKSDLRERMVLEIQFSDVVADPAAYAFARDVVSRRGYTVAIDGANDLTLPIINRQGLGAAYVKLYWAERLAHRDSVLSNAIERIGKKRIVLCCCDGNQAVEWGRSVGIEMFQGHHIDQLLKTAARSVAKPKESPGTAARAA